MKSSLPCPVNAPSRCGNLIMESIDGTRTRCREAAGLIARTFPHMLIPEKFWERKVCMDNTIAVMENGNTVIAIANTKNDKGITSIDCLAVDPVYQGSGIGSMLLREVEREASRSGSTSIRLTTEQSKPQNVIFYSKHGYKVTGVDPIAYKHSPGIKFEKRVTASIPRR